MFINPFRTSFIALFFSLTICNIASSDPISSFSNEMWDMVGFTWNDKQLANFIAADVENSEGRLKIKTKTGGFSFGGKGSKFLLKGDFDIQTDLKFDLLRKYKKFDQIAFFSIHHGGENLKDFFDRKLISFSVARIEGKRGKFSVRAQMNRNKSKKYYKTFINSIDGSLKFVRVGHNVTAYYKESGQSKWNKLASIPFITKPVMVTIGLRNYSFKRTSISASDSIMAIFDNFSINSSQGIIEADI